MTKTSMMIGTAVAVLLSGLVTSANAGDGILPYPTDEWDGFYIGINGGYGSGVVSDGNTGFGDLDIEGWLAGGQAGYSFVLDGGFVIGLEGSYDWADEVGTLGDGTTAIGIFNDATLTNTVNWQGDLVARAGASAGPIMVYGLGGLAVASNTIHIVGTNMGPVESEVTNTHLGWTAGAGVSAIVGQISTFIEYRYSDYGTADYTPAVSDDPVGLTDQQVRLGINYHMR
jgi:opacity protein-like surface antigen